MGENVERVICTDGGCNAAEIAALMNNRQDPMAMAAMMNQNGFNSPWMYLIFLALFGGGGFGWGNRGEAVGENYNSRQIAALQNSVNDNHNNDIALQAINGNRDALGQLAQTFNTDLGNIQTAICGVKSAIEQVGGQVGYSAESVKNAIALGDSNIIQQMQTCCCQTKTAILEQGYQNQLANERQTNVLQAGLTDVRQAVVNGFANVGYQQSQNTAAIINAGNANTQRILDQMCANQTQALRDVIAEKDRQLQSASIVNQLKANGCTCGC